MATATSMAPGIEISGLQMVIPSGTAVQFSVSMKASDLLFDRAPVLFEGVLDPEDLQNDFPSAG
jgi:hypothetical protein